MYRISIAGRLGSNAVRKAMTCVNYQIFQRNFISLNFKNIFGGLWFRRRAPNVLVNTENAVAECGNKLANLIKFENIDKNIEEFYNYTTNICILSSLHENIIARSKNELLGILNDHINTISNNSLILVTKIFNYDFNFKNGAIIREWMRRLSRPDQINQFSTDVLLDSLTFLLNNQILPSSREIKNIVEFLSNKTNHFTGKQLVHFYHSIPINAIHYDEMKHHLYKQFIHYIESHQLTKDEIMDIIHLENISNDFLMKLSKPILDNISHYSPKECVDILCQYAKISLYNIELINPVTKHIMSNLHILDNNFDRFVLLLPKLTNYTTTIDHQYLLNLFIQKTNKSNEIDIGRAISVISAFDIGDSVFQRNINNMINLLNNNISNLPVKYFSQFLDSLVNKHPVLRLTYYDLIHQTILTNPIYYIKNCLMSYTKFIYCHRDIDPKKIQLLIDTIRSNINEVPHDVVISFIQFIFHTPNRSYNSIEHLDSLFIDLRQHIYKEKIILSRKDMQGLLELSRSMSFNIKDLLNYYFIQVSHDYPTFPPEVLRDLVYLQLELDPKRELDMSSILMGLLFSNKSNSLSVARYKLDYDHRSIMSSPGMMYQPTRESDLPTPTAPYKRRYLTPPPQKITEELIYRLGKFQKP